MDGLLTLLLASACAWAAFTVLHGFLPFWLALLLAMIGTVSILPKK